MSVLSPLDERFPNSELYFVTKEEFSSLVLLHPKVKKVFSFNKQEGIFGLIRFALALRKEKFDIVYDAHSNVRSGILRLILKPFSRSLFIQRPKERIKRISIKNLDTKKVYRFITTRQASMFLNQKGRVNLRHNSFTNLSTGEKFKNLTRAV